MWMELVLGHESVRHVNATLLGAVNCEFMWQFSLIFVLIPVVIVIGAVIIPGVYSTVTLSLIFSVITIWLGNQ